MVERLRHLHAPLPRPPLEQIGQHVLDVDVDLLDRGPGDDLERRQAPLRYVNLDLAIVETPIGQLSAQPGSRPLMLLTCRARIVLPDRGRQRRQQQIEQPLLGVLAGLHTHLDQPLIAHHVHREPDEVAHHRLDVTAHVADLGELRCLDLDERRLRQPREPPGDLGLSDTGGADHQDVLWRHLLGQIRRQLLTPHPVAQRNRDGALRLRLRDDELVELSDDLPGGQGVERRLGYRVWRGRLDRLGRIARLGKVDGHL